MANCCQSADKRSAIPFRNSAISIVIPIQRYWDPEIQSSSSELQIASENFINSDWNQQSVSAVMDHTASIMPINVDTSATGRRHGGRSSSFWLDFDFDVVDQKHTPKFVQPSLFAVRTSCPPKWLEPQSLQMIGLQISWCFCVTRGMPATASFKFQLTFNDLAILH